MNKLNHIKFYLMIFTISLFSLTYNTGSAQAESTPIPWSTVANLSQPIPLMDTTRCSHRLIVPDGLDSLFAPITRIAPSPFNKTNRELSGIYHTYLGFHFELIDLVQLNQLKVVGDDVFTKLGSKPLLSIRSEIMLEYKVGARATSSQKLALTAYFQDGTLLEIPSTNLQKIVLQKMCN